MLEKLQIIPNRQLEKLLMFQVQVSSHHQGKAVNTVNKTRKVLLAVIGQDGGAKK